jgi:hypothetical protein
MDFERWLQEDLLSRRTKPHRLVHKQIAQDAYGRVRVTIKPLPGRPLLSKGEADAIFSAHFMGHTGLREVDMRDTEGLKVEGYGNTTWGAYVEPMVAWPIKLPHPSYGPKFYYLYMMQSSFSNRLGLCGSCHQSNCTAESMWKCKVHREAQRAPIRKDSHSRPLRGYTTLAHAYRTDPMARVQSSYYHHY